MTDADPSLHKTADRLAQDLAWAMVGHALPAKEAAELAHAVLGEYDPLGVLDVVLAPRLEPFKQDKSKFRK